MCENRLGCIHGRVLTISPAEPTVPCCDICDPTLLDRTRPGCPPRTPRQTAVKRGVPDKAVQVALNQWRKTIKERDFEHSLFAASAILSDKTLELLASVGPIPTKAKFTQVLAGQWEWAERYGDDLFAKLSSLSISAMVPLPKKPRGAKRSAPENHSPATVGLVDAAPATTSTSKRPRLEQSAGVSSSRETGDVREGLPAIPTTIPSGASQQVYTYNSIDFNIPPPMVPSSPISYYPIPPGHAAPQHWPPPYPHPNWVPAPHPQQQQPYFYTPPYPFHFQVPSQPPSRPPQ